MAESNSEGPEQVIALAENDVSTTINGSYTSDKTMPETDVCTAKNGMDAEESSVESSNLEVSNQTSSEARKAPLLLRPSALSRDFKPFSSLLKPSNLSAVASICNKFATVDDSAESLFNIPRKSDKADGTSSTPTTPAVMPMAIPLSNPNYVFGQNIKDRVANNDSMANNGNGDMLFTSAVNAETSKKDKTDEKESSSLLEDAARCEQQRNAKRKYEEVQVTTGEEDEMNVLQMVVKLFAFEGGLWVERGRGSLRLNDSGGGAARIVIRTLGSLRVILNTKIWGGMQVSRASDKSIRTTAMDAAGVIRIFLIQASPSDINTLVKLMELRVQRCREQEAATQVEECSSTTNDAEKEQVEEGDNARPAKVPALDPDSSST